MSTFKILFIQGAGEGAFDEDKLLADAIRNQQGSGAGFHYPKLEGLEKIDWAVAAKELSNALSKLEAGGIVIAHSLGGAALLKLLSEHPEIADISSLYLIATPYKVKDGEWGTDDFAIDLDFASRLPHCAIRLFHSRDDEFVPFEHLQRYGDKLPNATLIGLDGYGHQFSPKPFNELFEMLGK